jgi:hypothetical protein
VQEHWVIHLLLFVCTVSKYMMAVAMLQQSMSIAATAKLGFNIRGEFRVQQQLNFNRSRAVVSWGYGRLQRFVESTPQKQQLRIVLIANEGQQQQATRRQTQQKKLRAESSIAEDVGSRSIDSGLAHFVRLSLSLSCPFLPD